MTRTKTSIYVVNKTNKQKLHEKDIYGTSEWDTETNVNLCNVSR